MKTKCEYCNMEVMFPGFYTGKQKIQGFHEEFIIYSTDHHVFRLVIRIRHFGGTLDANITHCPWCGRELSEDILNGN